MWSESYSAEMARRFFMQVLQGLMNNLIVEGLSQNRFFQQFVRRTNSHVKNVSDRVMMNDAVKTMRGHVENARSRVDTFNAEFSENVKKGIDRELDGLAKYDRHYKGPLKPDEKLIPKKTTPPPKK